MPRKCNTPHPPQEQVTGRRHPRLMFVLGLAAWVAIVLAIFLATSTTTDTPTPTAAPTPQTVKLTGTVTDATTVQPIEDATVRITVTAADTIRYTSTGSTYSANIPPGAFVRYEVSAPVYIPQTLEAHLNVKAGQTFTGPFRLERMATPIGEEIQGTPASLMNDSHSLFSSAERKRAPNHPNSTLKQKPTN